MRGVNLAGGLMLTLAVAACGTRAATLQEGPKQALSGPWSGTLTVKEPISIELRLVFRFKEEAGKLGGVMVSPDQGPTEYPLEVAVDGSKVTLEVPNIRGKFTGTLDDAAKKLTGEWVQGPIKVPLVLEPGEPVTVVEAPEALLGLWEGTLDVGVAKLRIVLRVEKKDGKCVPVLDSVDQTVKGIPINAIKLDGDKLTFESKGISGKYEGKLDTAKGVITGTWKQLGQSYTLDLKKTDKVTEVKRPQNPVGPLPYVAEEVTVPTPDAKITLAGTLTLPQGKGPFPAVVLITGSGPQDRDETLMGHKPFLVLADHLTRQGIAVLRCDDRGFGKSTGPGVMDSTSADLANDAIAGVQFLLKDKRIDAKHIGLAGHSEGGVIAPIVAVQCPDVAYIVLLAGTGVTGEEILVRQSRLIAAAEGAKETTLALQEAGLKKVLDIVRSEPDPAKAEARIREAGKELATGVAASEAAAKAASGGEPKSEEPKTEAEKSEKEKAETAAVEARISLLNNTWFRFFLTYDPRVNLRKVKVPVLVLNGAKDLQVEPAQNLPEIKKALEEAGNTRFEIVEFPGLNHLFQHAKTGSLSEYSNIEETMAPEVLDKVAKWILEVSK